MTKIEFVDSIRRGISGLNDYVIINDTVNYYQEYIETAIRKGRSEEEVLEELGDPRLIAKSIMASHQAVPDGAVEDEEEKRSDSIQLNTSRGRNMVIPMWLVKAGLIVGGVVVLGVVGFVFVKLIPVICIAALAVMIYRFFRDNFLN